MPHLRLAILLQQASLHAEVNSLSNMTSPSGSMQPVLLRQGTVHLHGRQKHSKVSPLAGDTSAASQLPC